MTQSATDRRPQSLTELARISGVGDCELERYWAAIPKLLAKEGFPSITDSDPPATRGTAASGG